MTDVKNLKVYIIAGEPSGDLLGSRFMRAMVKKTNGQVEFYGVGGESMEKAGLKSLFDISDLAIMGLAEVIPSIPKVLRLIKQTIEVYMVHQGYSDHCSKDRKAPRTF